MEEDVFKSAIAAISSNEFSEEDVKTVKKWLETLKTKENAIKRKIEQEKNTFVKNKSKNNSKLKEIKSEIKTIKNILKNSNGDR